MNDTTSLLTIIAAVIACGLIIRVLGRIISWPIVLTILAIAVLVVLGLLDINPILTELGYATTNLFGGIHEPQP
jgi:hypothetical protein